MKVSMMALALAGFLAGAGTAQAQTVIALMDGNMIAPVDAKTWTAGTPMKVSGVEGKLVGIDVRPADGMLYGLFDDGTVAVIDATSGKATKKSKLSTMLAPGVAATVDFNPVADRLRVIGSDGTNLRANVDDGKVTTDGTLKFADTDMHKGETPNIVAGSYTNSMKGAKETTLYNIDATIGALVKQAPPNDGVLNAVGKLGVSAKNYAFDIVMVDAAASEGWLLADGTLYRVDLAKGAASEVGKIKDASGTVHDIAIVPAM
ncbi:DUF4394 domain-containing protein [Ancylobacter sp. A5.8]|uniref:DUF4394 domain-containing protein n=1 Tax=Ancylobacter gelatini TaxID=2919920 RepID=UPI001F4E3151|nr:DUF4394 domain-containing protein [Ancylobacter gelatini]MCJ8144639.1 DUF4394 domain-containing protein [Ancylobacter gelatini]